MKKSLKYITGALAIILVSLLIVFVIRYLQGNSIRKQLPLVPDLTNAGPALRQQISEAGRKADKKPAADNIGMLGMVYNSGAYYNEAATCYRLAADLDRKSWIWSYYLGYLNMELGNSDEAIGCFGEVTMINPSVFMALYYSGGAYQNLNITDSALKIFNRLANMDGSLFILRRSARQSYYPLPVYARFELSRIYMSSGRIEEAEKTLKELKTDFPSFGPAYRQLGTLYGQKGDSSASRYYYSRANDLAVYFPPADTLIDKIALISRSEAYLTKQIELAIRTSNSGLAFTLLKNGLNYMPDNKYLLSSIIKGYLTFGMGSKALPYLDKHLNGYVTDMKELKDVGRRLMNSGFKDQAVKYLMTAADIKTGNPASFSEIAIWLSDMGESEKALRIMNEFIEKNPENTRVMSDAVYLFMQRKEFDKSNLYLERLRQLPDSYSRVRIFEGMIAERDGRTDEALKQYELSFNANPDNLPLVNMMLQICYMEKRWGKAAAILGKASDHFSGNPDLQLKYGELLIKCEDKRIINTGLGIEYSERAFLNSSSSVQTRVAAAKNLAVGFRNLGERARAEFFIGRAVDIARRSDAPDEILDELAKITTDISAMK